MIKPKTHTLTFNEMLEALDHLPAVQKAAIRVHDDLDVARSIALNLFGHTDSDLVFKIRMLLVEEENHVSKDTPDGRRVNRKA